MTQEITGKQVLCELETLLCDAGMYLYSVGLRAYNAVKAAVNKHRTENAEKADSSDAEGCCDVVSADGKVICSVQND